MTSVLQPYWTEDAYCAWRDRVIHERMNANGFILPYDLFSWNKQLMVRCLSMVTQNTVTIYIQNSDHSQYYCMYSVHDGSLLSRRTRLPAFLVAPWDCYLLHCCWSTAYLVPCLEGRALPHSPPSGWPHFPQGPCIFPLPRRLHLLCTRFSLLDPNRRNWFHIYKLTSIGAIGLCNTLCSDGSRRVLNSLLTLSCRWWLLLYRIKIPGIHFQDQNNEQ